MTLSNPTKLSKDLNLNTIVRLNFHLLNASNRELFPTNHMQSISTHYELLENFTKKNLEVWTNCEGILLHKICHFILTTIL